MAKGEGNPVAVIVVPIVVAIITAVGYILAAIFANLPPFDSDDGDDAVSFVGRVLTESDQEPIGDAKVIMEGLGAPGTEFTDSEGYFEFVVNQVLEGKRRSVTIVIQKQGYRNYRRTESLLINEEDTHYYYLKPSVPPPPDSDEELKYHIEARVSGSPTVRGDCVTDDLVVRDVTSRGDVTGDLEGSVIVITSITYHFETRCRSATVLSRQIITDEQRNSLTVVVEGEAAILIDPGPEGGTGTGALSISGSASVVSGRGKYRGARGEGNCLIVSEGGLGTTGEFEGSVEGDCEITISIPAPST